MADDKKSKNYFDDPKHEDGRISNLIIPTFIIGAMGGIAGMGIGLTTDELLLPTNDDQHAGYEMAAEQYERMFTLLEQRSELAAQKQMEFGSLANIGDTPDLLKGVVGMTEKEAEVYQDVTTARAEIDAADLSLSTLAQRFALSAIVDERLSERDVKDLFERFEENVGDIETLASIQTPDYADLDASRAYVKENSSSLTVEADKARLISEHSNDINGGIVNDITVPGGFFLGILLMLMSIREEWKNSSRHREKMRNKKGLKH